MNGALAAKSSKYQQNDS